MSVTLKKRAMLPSLASNFYTGRSLYPDVFDFDRDLFEDNGRAVLVPDANIVENDSSFGIDLAAPGLERKDFKVEVDNGTLIISAEKKEEKEEKENNYRRREFSYSSFRRIFTLPENSITDRIDAKYENGILHLSVPKKEVGISKPAKQIKVG